MRIRYYADEEIDEIHDYAIELLGEIHGHDGIVSEIVRIESHHGEIQDFPSDVRKATPEEVYERDLKRNPALNAAIDATPSEAFKRYGELEIAGNVAIVDEEGTVQWASTLPGYADGYGPGVESQTAIDFLEDVAVSPSNRFCVSCLSLVEGDENFCPTCGYDLA